MTVRHKHRNTPQGISRGCGVQLILVFVGTGHSP
uniref:Uncharacterized protein n=2 Tax=Anguilla anguilla TaxID=7936 RepID=A0A0E9TTI7_ANGAN